MRSAHAGLGLGGATPALEVEGAGDHADGEGTWAYNSGHDGSAARTGATLACCDEDHVRALDGLADLLLVVLGGLAADRGVRSRAQSPGEVAADVQLDVRVAHEQGLGVGVDGDELDAAQSGLDHAVDGVDAAAADAHHLDDCLVVLRFRHCCALRCVPGPRQLST